MRTVSVFKNGNNQAVRLPKDMEFEDVSELEIIKIGEVITLRPIISKHFTSSRCRLSSRPPDDTVMKAD